MEPDLILKRIQGKNVGVIYSAEQRGSTISDDIVKSLKAGACAHGTLSSLEI